MLKRLIGSRPALKEVSEQSAQEKSIKQGHISNLHILVGTSSVGGVPGGGLRLAHPRP